KKLIAHEMEGDFYRGGAVLLLYTTAEMMEKVKHQLEKLIEVEYANFTEGADAYYELSEKQATRAASSPPSPALTAWQYKFFKSTIITNSKTTMAKINFGGVIEEVVTREEFPMEKALDALKQETIAIIGYGVQGPAQSLNLRDNGFNVIVGQRKGSKTWGK